jgi:glycerol-3-phosphate O-acyltransferase/dihydroxyacetone phosphate acyltransferase
MVDYNELFFNCCQCIISWIFKVTAAIYFKEIKTGGAHNIPESGPVIFAIGPHSNQVSTVCLI